MQCNDLEYPKELRGLHNNYYSAPDKIEIKKEMLSNQQLKITDFYNILIGTVTELVPNVFDKEKYALCYENLKRYLSIGLKLKNTSCIRFQSIAMAKTIFEFNTQKGIKAGKNDDKDGKVL